MFLLRFDWCDVAERFEQAFPVEPIDPLQGFLFDLILGFPWPQSIDDFGFEQADDRLGQRIVIAVADLPTDGSNRASTKRSVYSIDTYCDPRSE